MNKITTVFFDLGNTLVNYHRGKLTDEEKDFLGLKQMYEFLSSFDKTLTFLKLFEGFYLKWIEKLNDREYKDTEYDVVSFLLSVLSENCRNKIKKEQIVLAFKAFHEPTARFVEYEENLASTLSNLKNKNLKLAIISNTPIPGYCHNETLKKLNLLQYFENKFYSYDLDFKKPNKKIFEYAVNQTNSKFEESVFVGDSLKKDIAPALNLKMKAVFLNNKGIELPDEISSNKNFLGTLNRLSDLEKIIPDFI